MMNLDLRTELEESFEWDEEDVEAALEILHDMVVLLQKENVPEEQVPSRLRASLLASYLPHQVESLIKYFFRGALSYKEIES